MLDAYVLCNQKLEPCLTWCNLVLTHNACNHLKMTGEVVEVYLITAEKCLWAHIFWKRLNELFVFMSVCSGRGMSEFLKCNFLSF